MTGPRLGRICLGLGLALVLALTGCNSDSTDRSAGSDPATTTAPANTGSDAEAAAEPDDPVTDRPVLAAADSTDLDGLRIEIHSLERRPGDFMRLEFTFANEGTDEYTASFDFVDGLNGSQAHSFGGITVVDRVNNLEGIVVTDESGACLCTGDLISVEPGQRILSFAEFGAPPPDVATVDVIVPHFPPFDEIAITG